MVSEAEGHGRGGKYIYDPLLQKREKQNIPHQDIIGIYSVKKRDTFRKEDSEIDVRRSRNMSDKKRPQTSVTFAASF